MNENTKEAKIGYQNCDTQAVSTSEEIVYSNSVHYSAVDGFNFFSNFDLKSTISQTNDVTLVKTVVLDENSLIGDIEDDFTLGDYASLVLIEAPEGKQS